MKELADELAVLRTALATPTIRDDHLRDAADAVVETARVTLAASAGRGWFGRVVGFDPATILVIVQLALMIVELIRQLRELRRRGPV